MRRFLPLLLLPVVAFGGGVPVAQVSGPSVKEVNVGIGKQAYVQCVGYSVLMATGYDSKSLGDAGSCTTNADAGCSGLNAGSQVLDFTLAGTGYDPYPVKLANNENTVTLGSNQSDGGYTCTVNTESAQTALQRTGGR